MADLAALQKGLGHEFQRLILLQQALTHPSLSPQHNQRLEFLGDAVLELCVSEMLYRAFTNLSEGVLTRMRAELVCEDALSEAAERLGLNRAVRLSVGEERSGGRQKKSILCDIMESVIGAVHLDGGREAANRLIDMAIGDRVRQASPKSDHLDTKSRLQSILQAEGKMPVYEMISRDGPSHKPVFRYKVMVDGETVGEGEGGSKQLAQTEAAQNALKKLKQG